MAQGRRIEKTIAKTRHGGLPAATDEKPSVESGNSNLCSGCGETIEPAEQVYFVRPGGLMLMRFHDVCYNAWATFKRS